MFVLSRNVSASYRVIATLVATAVVLWAMGAYNYAQAVSVTDVYDLLSDSAPLAESNHTIQFLAPSGVAAGETMVVTFPAGFDLTSITEDDVDLEVNGTDELTAAAASGATWGASVSGQALTFTSGTDTIGGTATITVKIGTNALQSGIGANQIVNPNPAGGNGSYEILISAGTGTDTGATRVVILDTVLVTANVESTFTFEVEGNGSGETVNGETTTEVSSSTTIPFGTLVAGPANDEVLSQDLVVNTNAINGFVVTVEEDQHLESETGADIDNFANNNNSVTPASWSTPTNSVGNENTWGHWGITTEDTDTTRTAEFGANQWLGVSTTPTVIFSHTGPADGITAGIGSTTVGYKVEITALQEAADDYTTTLTYIATPTF